MDVCTIAASIGSAVVIPTVIALWAALQSERKDHRETLMRWREADQRRIEMLERLHMRASEDQRP